MLLGAGGQPPKPLVALLQIGGVEPQIRPFAFQRPVEKRADALIDFFSEFGNLRFGPPDQVLAFSIRVTPDSPLKGASQVSRVAPRERAVAKMIPSAVAS
jgi:hypothetical protein